MKPRPARCSRALAIAVLGLVLAACVATSPQQEGTSSEPVSKTPAVGDARNRAKIHTELASLYFENANMAVALEEVRIALAADAGYAPAYNVRGLVHMYLRENGAADESFRRAVALAPGDPEVNNNYGWFLCQTGREREALPYFTAAIKNPLYPTPEKSYINAGLCAMRVNDLAAAEDFFDKAQRFGPRAAAALFPLADVKFRRGEYVDSRRLLGEFHRQSEPTAESLWLGVRVERRLGDRSGETSYATQLRRRFPDSRESQELKRGNYE